MPLKLLLPLRRLFFFFLCLFALAAKAQLPASFSCYITNATYISTTIYQFDLYLVNTSTNQFKYAQGQWGIKINSAVANGGTLTPSIVSSDLNGASQGMPDNDHLTLPTVSYVFNILSMPAASTSGAKIISSTNSSCSSPGTRIG